MQVNNTVYVADKPTNDSNTNTSKWRSELQMKNDGKTCLNFRQDLMEMK